VDTLQHLNVLLVVRGPKLNTVLTSISAPELLILPCVLSSLFPTSYPTCVLVLGSCYRYLTTSSYCHDLFLLLPAPPSSAREELRDNNLRQSQLNLCNTGPAQRPENLSTWANERGVRLAFPSRTADLYYPVVLFVVVSNVFAKGC